MKLKLFTVPIFVIMIVAVIAMSSQATMFFAKNLDLQKEIQKLQRSNVTLERNASKLNTSFKNLKELNSVTDFKLFAFRALSHKFDSLLDIIFKISKEQKVDPYIVIGIIKTESYFNPKAQSYYKDGRKCAFGIMQINYSAWQKELDLDLDKIFDIEYNIIAGIKIFKHYLKLAKGDVHKALFYYNNGPGNLYNNQKYVPKIMNFIVRSNEKLNLL